MNHRIVILLGLLLPLLGLRAQAGQFTVKQSDRGVAVLLDGKLFTEYRIDTGFKPILWPVIGPTGARFTRAYPMEKIEGERQDHHHQRSIWFTHGDVNGVDFWSETDKSGRIVHRRYEKVEGGDVAVITTLNDWLTPDGKKLCEDQRTLRFLAGKDWRAIDFDLKISATDEPVTFGDTKEGAMGVRVPTSVDVDSKLGGRLVTSEGQVDREAWGKRAPWVDYYGPIEGQIAGIAMFNHPTSFRFPTYWHARTYGLLAANPFGLRHFTGAKDNSGAHTIKPGQSMVLRYRILLHAGDTESAKVADHYEAYATSAEK